jgi:hypothetical protein
LGFQGRARPGSARPQKKPRLDPAILNISGNPSGITISLGTRNPIPSGRKDRAPPKNRLSRRPGICPRKAVYIGGMSPWRGGLCTPARTPLALLERVPGRPPALRLPPGRHAIPGLACGLPTRARRPHPSEKTALRAVPRFVSVKPSILGGIPAEGRAPHAREEGSRLDPGHISSWPPCHR